MYSERIKKIITKAGRDWFILIIALLLAAFMWTVQNFSKGYSKYFSYKVSVKTFMPGRSQIATSNNVMVLRGKSSGYYIMRKSYTNELDQIEISVDPKLLHKSKSDNNSNDFYLLSEDIMEQVQNALGSDLQLEWFASDTLFFNFPLKYNKKVPIIMRSVLKYRSQYMLVGDLEIEPDSVVIFGENEVIEGVNSVYTKVIEEDDINSSFEGITPIVPFKNIEVSQKDISYKGKVVRYVENTIKLPVTVVNVPQKVNVIVVPREVMLRYRINIDNKNHYNINDFKISVNYKDIMNSSINKAMLGLTLCPNEVIGYSIEPKVAEFIMN